VAQIAAVVGRQFSSSLLERITAVPAAELAVSLERLVDGGILLPRAHAADASFAFKHALMRDVAYESLLRARRQQLHERIARTLEEHFPGDAQSEPEFLAYHFRQAGLADRAGIYCERAGERAVERYAYAEAVAHFTAGLADARSLPGGTERASRELQLLLKLGPALATTTGSQNPEVEAAYARAYEIAKSEGHEPSVFKALWGLWFTAHVTSKLETSHARAQELVSLARRTGDADQLLEAFHCAWGSAFMRGDHPTAFTMSRDGLDRYDPVRDAWMGGVFGGHDPAVCAHGTQAGVFAVRGDAAQVTRSTESGLRLAESLEHPQSLTQGLQIAMVNAQMIGDHAAVDRYSRRMLAVAQKYDLAHQRAHAQFHLGWALTASGDVARGLEIMEAQFPRICAGPLYRYYAAVLAKAQLDAGKASVALALVDAALATVAQPGVGLHVPELHRLRGECLFHLDAGHFEAALRALGMAADAARRQGAPLWQLRAAISTARVCACANQGRRGLAQLSEIHASLPGGFQSSELGEARALLSA
jgi:hypothetical protein